MLFIRKHTECDTWVLVANVLSLLVGKEHVCRQTTLGRVRIYEQCQRMRDNGGGIGLNIPFFFFSVRALVARFAVFSLGILRSVEASVGFQLMSATAQIYCDRIGSKIEVVNDDGGGWTLVVGWMGGLLFWCDKGEGGRCACNRAQSR